MKRKKGDSAPHPSIFHPDIYVPISRKANGSNKQTDSKLARPQSRLLKLPRPDLPKNETGE